MNGHAKAVLWIGLVLIVLNLFYGGGWSHVWKTITSGGSGFSVTPSLPLPFPFNTLPIAKTTPTPTTAKSKTVLV
jgi:hypothetical protein